MRVRKTAAFIGLALVAAACGQGQPVATSPEPSPVPVAIPCDSFRHEGGDQDAAMFLATVKVAGQAGYDRITFEFVPHEGQEAKVPYFLVERHAPPLTEDPSDEPVEVEGSAFLRIIYWASGVDMSGEEFVEVYTGPKLLDPSDTDNLEQLVAAGDFENTSTWFAGLRRAACFTVREMHDPSRIVVDVSHETSDEDFPTPEPSP